MPSKGSSLNQVRSIKQRPTLTNVQQADQQSERTHQDMLIVNGRTPGSIVQLQRTLGNQAVAQMLAQPSRSPQANSPGIVQRRGENPHAKAGAHEGWDLTAHHIIAHSQLIGAKDKIKEKDKENDTTKWAEVLKHAIPDIITKSMLENMKVVLEDTPEARATLRARLVSDDQGEVNNIRLNDIRESFFEWQGGNQFQGPNTSIRAEPSSSKDAIDYDGQFFTPLSGEKFSELTERGRNLKTEEDQDALVANLKAILDITRNVVPNVFDASKWTEVGSMETLIALSKLKTVEFSRAHILGYSFFKLSQSDIASAKYDQIKAESGGAFSYAKLNIPSVQIKGTLAYISLETAQGLTPTTKEQKDLSKVLEALNIAVTPDDKGNYAITVNDNITVTGKKFTVKGYESMPIPLMAQVGSSITVNKAMFDKKKMDTVTPGKSLYTYCLDNNIPTSSFLPTELYQKLVSGQ